MPIEKIQISELNVDVVPQGKENVLRVLSVIKEKNLNARVWGHPQTAVTSLQLHLEVYGGTPGEVLKCLCMVSKNRPLVVMASGEVKIDTNKLSKVTQMKDVRMANRPGELEQLFGRVPGGVDPLTIPVSIPVFADERLFQKMRVTGSSGSPYAGLEIDPNEILKVRSIQVADLAQS